MSDHLLEKERVVLLTDTAVSYLRSQITNSVDGKGIRLGVKNAGCSGFAYTLELATEIKGNDVVVQWDDVTVVMNPEHLPFLQGIELHCVQEGLNQHLKFRNPNAAGECGCGESFSVRSEASD